MKRSSGILMPIFSLPSPYGIGTLGKAAYDFADFLAEAGQHYWQMLPLGPTSYGDSPYQSFSTFAGNPYFIDPIKKGAQAEENIVAPNAEFFRACNAASGGKIRLVTLAPNMPGSLEFIKEVSDEVMVSIGHTTADYDTALAAMKAGAHHVTHLYNAMPPFAHRNPGVIGAAFDDPECRMELICDGYHIHGAVVRATFSMMGSERMVLISDSMMATGMPNGTYSLGGQAVWMKDGKATLTDGETIAGSATNLYDCMRKAVSFDIPLADAIFAATRNPAQSIGIYDEVGSIAPGKKAHVLLVDDELNLKQVIM